jgi:methylmalonyl-CoA mutase cobalamin-binding subunit
MLVIYRNNFDGQRSLRHFAPRNDKKGVVVSAVKQAAPEDCPYIQNLCEEAGVAAFFSYCARVIPRFHIPLFSFSRYTYPHISTVALEAWV